MESYPDDYLLLLNSYPYGHEELAVCEDIEQVCDDPLL